MRQLPPRYQMPDWFCAIRKTRRGEHIQRLLMVYGRATKLSLIRGSDDKAIANARAAWRLALEAQSLSDGAGLTQ